MTWHPRAKCLWKCPCWRDKEVLPCIFWYPRGGSLWYLPFISSPSFFHGTLSPSLSGLAFWPHAFRKPGGQSLWYVIPVSVLSCLLSAGSGYNGFHRRKNRRHICPGPGRGWAHTPPSASRNAKLSQGIRSCRSLMPHPSIPKACLSPWKINSLPQDPGDTAEGSHFCKQ